MKALRQRAQQLVANAAADDPDVVALAEVVSLALTVDRGLLRAARRVHLRRRGPELEADLWHSPLVGWANASGIVLDSAVRDELRIRLRADPDRYRRSYELIEREHEWLPETLRFEEELAYQTLMPGGPERMRARLAALSRHVADQTGLEPWFEGLETRLPAALRERGGGGPAGARAGRPAGEAEGFASRLGVRLLDGAVEFRAAGPPRRGWHELALPPHLPPLVHIDGQAVDLEALPQLQPIGDRRSASIETLDGARLTLVRLGRRRRDSRPGMLRARDGEASAVAFSSDGLLVASAGDEGVIRLRDVTSGREVLVLRGHEALLRVLAFAPGGRLLASASDDRAVRVWDVHTGREALVLRRDAGVVLCVAFSPDGRLLASADDDGVVCLWDVAAGREALVLRGHAGPVRAVAFSPDGRSVVSAGDDGALRLWDVATGRDALVLPAHGSEARGVAFSPQGRLAASVSVDGTVRLWDLAAGREAGMLGHHAGPGWGIAFAPDGRRLASAGGDRVVRLWDVAERRAERILRGHESAVRGVAFSSDGRWLASAGADSVVRVWDVATREVQVVRSDKGRVLAVAFSPNGQLLASAGDDGVVRVTDASGREVLARSHGRRVWAVAFGPHGGLLASAGEDGAVRLWDVAEGREARALRGHTGRVFGVAISPDGGLLASAGDDGAVRLWGLTGGRLVRVLPPLGRIWAWGVAFSPDGRLLAAAGSDGTVRVWDVTEGSVVRELRGHVGPVWGVAFSPDGRLLASAGADAVVRVWEVAAVRAPRELLGHGRALSRAVRGGVWGVTFSPDGRLLASGGADQVVRVWDIAAGREAVALRGHDFRAWGVAFSPDGRLLASAGADGMARIWEMSGVGATATAVLSGPPPAICALAGAAAELAGNRLRWSTLLGIGGGALPAALLAAGLDSVEVRDLLVRRKLASALGPLGRLGASLRRRADGSLEEQLTAALAERGVHDWGDLATTTPDGSRTNSLQLALTDVATGRVAILPLEAARFGLDPGELPVVSVVLTALGGSSGGAAATIGGRWFEPALGRRLDLRPIFADQRAWRPAVLIDAGAAPHPRWPSGGPFAVVTVPELPPDRAQRPSRPQREVLTMVGADAARRAIDGRSLVDIGAADPRGSAHPAPWLSS